MSGARFRITTTEIATGTTKKTLLQIVAALNHAVLIREWSISFKGVDPTATPILVEVTRQTTAGTMSALTPRKDPDDVGEILQVTAQHTASVEPGEGEVLQRELVHPQLGYTWQSHPFDGPIKIGGGDRLGIVVTAGADVLAVVRASGEE